MLCKRGNANIAIGAPSLRRFFLVTEMTFGIPQRNIRSETQPVGHMLILRESSVVSTLDRTNPQLMANRGHAELQTPSEHSVL